MYLGGLTAPPPRVVIVQFNTEEVENIPGVRRFNVHLKDDRSQLRQT